MNKLAVILCILWGSSFSLASHGQGITSASQDAVIPSGDAEPVVQPGALDFLPTFPVATPQPDNDHLDEDFFNIPAFDDPVEPAHPTAEMLQQRAQLLSERAAPLRREFAYPVSSPDQDRYRLTQQMRDLSLYKSRQPTDASDQFPARIETTDIDPWEFAPDSAN